MNRYEIVTLLPLALMSRTYIVNLLEDQLVFNGRRAWCDESSEEIHIGMLVFVLYFS